MARETSDNELTITNNPSLGRFEIALDNALAILVYRVNNNEIELRSTLVPPQFEGRGMGSRLVKHALEFARKNNLKVVPLCWFVNDYVARHPEWKEWLKK